MKLKKTRVSENKKAELRRKKRKEKLSVHTMKIRPVILAWKGRWGTEYDAS